MSTVNILKRQIETLGEVITAYQKNNSLLPTSKEKLINNLLESGFNAKNEKEYFLAKGFNKNVWIIFYVEFAKKGVNVYINHKIIFNGQFQYASDIDKDFKKTSVRYKLVMDMIVDEVKRLSEFYSGTNEVSNNLFQLTAEVQLPMSA